MTVIEQIQIELFKGALSGVATIVTLLLTWIGGQQILGYWELRKRRKEMDIQSAQRFHDLIGEWKAIWRAWKYFKSSSVSANAGAFPATARWDLLDRAARAEGGVEAILLRLAIERELCGCERTQLGLFRQSFQQLREAIRDDDELLWDRKSEVYWLAHELAIRVSFIIDAKPPKVSLTPTDCERQLRSILAVDGPTWDKAISERSGIPSEQNCEL